MTTQRQARQQFSRGRGVFACESCGHMTRGTAESADSRVCNPCYELAGYENSCSDDGPQNFTDGMFADVEHHLAMIAKRGGVAQRDDWSGLYTALEAWKAAKGETPAAAMPALTKAGGTLLNLCYNACGDVTLYVNDKKAFRGTEQEAKIMGNGYGNGHWGVVYDRRK